MTDAAVCPSCGASNRDEVPSGHLCPRPVSVPAVSRRVPDDFVVELTVVMDVL